MKTAKVVSASVIGLTVTLFPAYALAAKESGGTSATWFLFGAGLFFLLIVVITSAKIVPQGSVGVIERFGRYVKSEGPGLVILMPMVSRMRLMSLKEQVDEYAPQFVITSDNVTVEVDAVLFFQIVDAAKAIYEVQHYHLAREKLTMTALRDIIGEMSLDQCLTSRERINARLMTILDDATEKWGVKVTRVEIRSIVPPEDIRVAMEKQMKAERDKRASILEAEGARQAAILLAEGEKQATILRAEGEREGSILKSQGRGQAYHELFGSIKKCEIDETLIAVRYLEALEKMANGKSTKMLLPVELTGILSSIAGIAEAARGLSADNGEKITM
ncbi:MAG: SPFH/Band 7/PHB domain protein [Chloroflexi bacterium]|nr:SPFH/Band 7/PHB domain protein [Chloroflexota bacterium]